jgi:hypothetical protein
MSDENKTPSDAKVEPKVSLEKACGAMSADVSALLSKTLSGFELDATDTKSRKRIFEAFVKLGAQHFIAEGLKVSSLNRRAGYAFRDLYPKSAEVPAYDNDNEDSSEADVSDDD